MKTLIIDSNNLIPRTYWTAKTIVGLKDPEKLNNFHIYFTLNAIKSYVNTYKPDKIFACWDEKPDYQRNDRKDLFSDYKGNRSSDTSPHQNNEKIKKFLYTLGIPSIFPRKLEADDVIATICNYLKTKPEQKIYIISGDEDFKQLGRQNLYFINFKTKKLLELTIDEAKIILHKKILLGDKSDCIKSIFPPKFSTKTKKIILESIEEFNIFIKTNKDIEKRYNENVKLIDFNSIPKIYIDLIISEFIKNFN